MNQVGHFDFFIGFVQYSAAVGMGDGGIFGGLKAFSEERAHAEINNSTKCWHVQQNDHPPAVDVHTYVLRSP